MAETTLHIRKNDIVKIISGKEKGKIGRVLKVSRDGGRITIEKVNMVKRHAKASEKNPHGGIIEKEAPLAYSNVLVMCDKCNQGTRIAIHFDANGNKNRACKRCGEIIEAKKK